MSLVFALLIAFFVVPIIPGIMPLLVNQPNRYRPQREHDEQVGDIDWDEKITTRDYPKSTFGIFTILSPGQVKIIERGGVFVRCIMAFSHHMFKGERSDNHYTTQHEEFWEVIETDEREFSDSHPLPFPLSKEYPNSDRFVSLILLPLSVPFWFWKRWVYWWTGAVFVGFWFDRIRAYPMERFKRVTQSDGEVKLVRKEDYSDHYRVAHFQYPIHIAKADTKDKIPVDVKLNEVAAVFNPYMVAYNTDDDWPTRFLGSVSNRVTMFTRGTPVDKVLSTENTDTAHELANFITEGGYHRSNPTGETEPTREGSTAMFGIMILESQVLDVSASNEKDEESLGALARANVQRDADKELAKGKAAYVREQGEALRAHPHADIVVMSEATVRAAEAASKNGGNVILGGSNVDPIQVAILQELKRSGIAR